MREISAWFTVDRVRLDTAKLKRKDRCIVVGVVNRSLYPSFGHGLNNSRTDDAVSRAASH